MNELTQTDEPESIASKTASGASPRRIRILIVDDSVVIRRLVSNALSSDEQIEIVGFAPNGEIALEKAAKLKPDVILLDIEMPVVDGLTTLKCLRQMGSEAYVIMFSTLTSRGASVTIDALLAGANDYAAKPSNTGIGEVAMSRVREELLGKIKQFFRERPSSANAAPSQVRPRFDVSIPRQQLALMPRRVRRVVAIGVSTGGPTALAEVLPRLKASFALPIVIVQHMPPMFTRQLADRLNAQCEIEVLEAEENMCLVPGRAVLAPGGFHMRLKRNAHEVRITLNQDPMENFCRPAVDPLFRSVAEIYEGHSIVVMMTGMGQDGLRGTEVLKSQGAYVIAQDQASSVVWGMPRAIAEAGLADSVVDVRSIAQEITSQLVAS